MKNLERLFAEKLLKIKAIKLQPANPFTWALLDGNPPFTVTTVKLCPILLFVIL